MLQMEKVIILKNREQSTDGKSDYIKEQRTEYKWAPYMGLLPELADTFADGFDRQQEQIRRQVGGARGDLQH
jgi:hypothetical protein